MIAKAPGKVVLSGAYAVLEGAPALVAAVDRYAVADARRSAARATPEVTAALARRGSGHAPWFDASALRDDTRDAKLGLGSSAAILVASIAALELARDPSLGDDALARAVFPAALEAHRAAQGGGSGIDVAASAFGGVLCFELSRGGGPRSSPFELPHGLFVEVWASRDAASTADMLARVAAFRSERPAAHAAIMKHLGGSAITVSRATSAAEYVEACREQLEGLGRLGDAAGAPIVTPATRAFDEALSGQGMVVLPSGAGGGDVALVVSSTPLHNLRGERFGFSRLELSLGARGVHADRAALREEGRNETAP
jgi:phosphomevalonate kinase